MAILDILVTPHPILKTKSKEVEKIDDKIIKQIKDMFETLESLNGVGLAANQVGITNRIFVMNVTADENTKGYPPVAMINPVITWESEEISDITEGCFSVPEQYAGVERPDIVKVKFLDMDGKEREEEYQGLASHCVQHELDHLDGILFVDHLSPLKRNMILKKLKKMQKERML